MPARYNTFVRTGRVRRACPISFMISPKISNAAHLAGAWRWPPELGSFRTFSPSPLAAALQAGEVASFRQTGGPPSTLLSRSRLLCKSKLGSFAFSQVLCLQSSTPGIGFVWSSSSQPCNGSQTRLATSKMGLFLIFFPVPVPSPTPRKLGSFRQTTTVSSAHSSELGSFRQPATARPPLRLELGSFRKPSGRPLPTPTPCLPANSTPLPASLVWKSLIG